ncbi:DUF6894 family protein [Belnapia rosea]|uniref:DUF6894 family protein n=1 Tax=Belnapia rosea TaxID=938405 RepID=UPI0038D0D184
MQCFFFHSRTNEALSLDAEGSELCDLGAAKKEAIATLQQMIADRLRSGGPANVPRIEIADQAGQTLAIVTLKDAIGLPR